MPDWLNFLNDPVWASLISLLLPLVFTLIPGLNNIVKLLPRSFWEAAVKAAGGTVTWPAPAKSKEILKTELDTMILRGYPTLPESSVEYQDYMHKVSEYQSAPSGGIIDTIKSNPLIIVAIIGGVLFFVTQKGGCQKPAPAPTPTPASGTLLK